jgi:hypothetical protein
MLGVPRELAEHSLDVSKTAKPVKQKLRRFAKDRKEVIKVEVLKLLAAEFIRECKKPVWLTNLVLVPKKTGKWRMCIDYTDLNRHCPNDPFPLSRIDQVINSTAGSTLLCFLDCYSGYHRIALKVTDQDKMTFIMPHGIYCYTTMTFGLKNTRMTYQNGIQKFLESQIGKNVEAYVDEVVIKTTIEDKLITDLAETFDYLWIYYWKLNLEKCVFDVPSGKLLGFMVSHLGIEANPTKVDAIHKTNQHIGKKRRHEAYWNDGGPRSLYQQAWGERPALLQAPEKVIQIPLDKRGRPGARGAEDLPEDHVWFEDRWMVASFCDE